MSDFLVTSDPSTTEEKPVENIRTLAGDLAKQLQQTVEFQELMRQVRLVNSDPEVSLIIQQIQRQETAYRGDDSDIPVEELRKKLEALPAYQMYIKTENATRELFQSVNQLISSEAGVNFASNARHQGCGCGG